MLTIEIPVTAMGKPRMTKRDKWAKRPCVMKYRAYADLLRAYVPEPPDANTVISLSWVAEIAMPRAWSQAKRKKLCGTLHRQKPDRDNIDKGILDALYKEDSAIAQGHLKKVWAETSRLTLTFEVADG